MNSLRDRIARLQSAPPLGAYHPPPPSPAALLAPSSPSSSPLSVQGLSYEADYREVDIPEAGPILVFATSRPWDALDVHISRPKSLILSADSTIAIGVFAKFGGVRVLVASGRLQSEGTIVVGPAFVEAGLPSWIAAARVPGAMYEVELSFLNTGVAIGPSQKIGIACVASNVAREPSFSIGQVGMNDAIEIANSLVRGAGAVPLVVAGVSAVNKGAAACFVQVHDVNSLAGLAGAVPCLPSFGIAAGQSFAVAGDLRHGRRNKNGIAVVTSSTADVYTALAGSVLLNGWFK